MGINLDYTNREVHISILSYVRDALNRFHHACIWKPQDQSYPHVNPTYGSKSQYAKNKDDSLVLSPANKKFIQELTGTFLYYARAIDTTMLPVLGSIATQQAAPTENIMQKVKQFLDYAATHPYAIITYRASDTVLATHSDASYLSEEKSKEHSR